MHESYCTALGELVKAARNREGLTQADLAEIVSVDERTILKIENHQANPGLNTVYSLIRRLQIDANAAFYPDLESSSPSTDEFMILLSNCTDTKFPLNMDNPAASFPPWHR